MDTIFSDIIIFMLVKYFVQWNIVLQLNRASSHKLT